MPRRGYSQSASGKEILEAIGYTAARAAGLKRAGVAVQTEWKTLLNQPGFGKRYEAGVAFITHGGRVFPVKGTPLNPGRATPHVASAPGQPPAKDRGLLAASVVVGDVEEDTVRVGMGGRRGRIGLALEYGVNTAGSQVGRHPGRNFRILPRPHARPAAELARDNMTDGVVVELRKNTHDARLQ